METQKWSISIFTCPKIQQTAFTAISHFFFRLREKNMQNEAIATNLNNTWTFTAKAFRSSFKRNFHKSSQAFRHNCTPVTFFLNNASEWQRLVLTVLHQKSLASLKIT